MASIFLLVMAGKDIGAGHYKRSSVLRNELSNSKYDTRLYIMDIEKELDYREIEGTLFFDYVQLFDNLMTNRPDILIVDMPIRYYSSSFLKKIREELIKVVLIDDDKECDDENIYDLMFACSMRFQHNLSTKKIIYGPRYMMINSGFSRLIHSERNVLERINNILLSFGGSDPNDITSQVLGFFQHPYFKDNFVLNVIVGQFAPKKEHNFVSDKKNMTVNFHQNITDMPKRLWDADLAIISGGMTLYEACCIGTPVITINQNAEQNAEAEVFNQANATYNLGQYNQISIYDFIQVFETILDKGQRISLSNSARNLIDGEGMQRIINQLATLL